jgi:hypothetical protein
VIGGPAEPFETVRPTTTARANPVGGVIGPKTGMEEAGMFGGPMATGRAGDQRRRHRNPDYDSNEHWPVPRGVPPVLEPGPEPTHDPGPILGPHP